MFRGWASDENVTKCVSWNAHKDITETQNIIESWITQYDKNAYNWVVELKGTQELIGNISAISVSKKHHKCTLWKQSIIVQTLPVDGLWKRLG